jgi:phospholipid/cholesterol/gamma-HCH transport system permease protein
MYPFDWYQYVLGILGGWMAGVYGGFTSAEFIDGAQRDFIPFHVYAFLKL